MWTLNRLNIVVVQLTLFQESTVSPFSSRDIEDLEDMEKEHFSHIWMNLIHKYRHRRQYIVFYHILSYHFLPQVTFCGVAVHCQVWAQEEEWSWFYCQVAKAIKALAASREQRETCPEKTDIQVFIAVLFKAEELCLVLKVGLKWDGTYKYLPHGKHHGVRDVRRCGTNYPLFPFLFIYLQKICVFSWLFERYTKKSKLILPQYCGHTCKNKV